MAEPNPFAFPGANVTHHSSEASLRAELAEAKRENATLQRELRDANDLNGLARARAAAKNEIQEAQREVKRAQMAERIARKALDGLRNTHVVAPDSMASQEEVVKSRGVPEDSKEGNGRPQVESETDQGLLAKTSESSGDTNDIHGDCKRDRKELIDRLGTLLRTESSRATAANRKLEDERNDLESRLAEAQGELEKLRDEAKRSKQALESVANLKDELYTLRGIHHDLIGEIEQRIDVGLAEANETSKRQQTELQDVKTRLTEATTEVQGLNHEVEGYGKELETARNEATELTKELDYEREHVARLNEINDLLRADLTAEQGKRKALAVERDEFQVRLAETTQTLEEIEQSESEARRALETSQDEFDSAARDLTQQHMAFQDDINGLTAQVEEHASGIAIKDQRIATLERENEVLKSRNEVFKSQLAESQVQKPAPKGVRRPNNYRSISMASHNSLADELGLEDDESIGGFSDDEEPAAEPHKLDLSAVHHIINVVPRDATTPRLTVSVSDAVFTTPRRQDSFVECSSVNSISSIEPSYPAAPRLSIYDDTVADFAPSQPAVTELSFFETTVGCLSPIDTRPAPLAVSEVSEGMDYAPVEAITTMGLQLSSLHVGETLNYSPVEPTILSPPSTAKSQRLTMHVFNHSVISLNPEPGGVLVTDPHTDRARSRAYRRGAELDYTGVDNRTHRQKCHVPLLPEHLNTNCPPSSCGDLNAMSRITALSLRRRSPIDPFTRSPQRSDPHDLEILTASWPIEDETSSEPAASPDTTSTLGIQVPATSIAVTPSSPVTTPCGVFTAQETELVASVCIFLLFLRLILGCHCASLLPVLLIFLFALTSTVQQLQSILPKPVSVVIRKGLRTNVHYLLHILMLALGVYCWFLWNQLQAWEQANGIGFGEGYGNASDDFGPYGNGHFLLSMLPLNWVSADSRLPARAIDVITSTVSAFEGLIGLGPTPSF